MFNYGLEKEKSMKKGSLGEWKTSLVFCIIVIKASPKLSSQSLEAKNNPRIQKKLQIPKLQRK